MTTHHADDCGVSCGLTECDCGAEHPLRSLLSKCREIAEWRAADRDECGVLANAVIVEIDRELERSVNPTPGLPLGALR